MVTVDADSYLYHDALQNIVQRYFEDPRNTRAVAGTVLVRNSRATWITKAQEWDYFHGISAIKRVQSLFQGTLGHRARFHCTTAPPWSTSAAGPTAWAKTSC
ncbi:MAG: hypothetical protein WKG03_10510 [Telluria sp.]